MASNYSITLHNPSEKSENSEYIRIGCYSHILQGNMGGCAGTYGFSKGVIKKACEYIPFGIQGNDDFALPPSCDNWFFTEDENIDEFDVIIKAKGGHWAKAMIYDNKHDKYLFRSATWFKSHHVAKNYRPSKDEEWVVGKKIFVASRSFWEKVNDILG